MLTDSLIANNPKEVLSDTTKVIFLAVVFVATLISSLLPLKLISKLRNGATSEIRLFYQRVVGLLNCFSGGVFMGTALLDLLPQVISDMMEIFPNNKFPFAQFIVAFGLLVILSIEQIGIECKEKTSDSRNPIERLRTRTVPSEKETLTFENQDELISVPSSPLAESINDFDSKSKFDSLLLLITLSLHSLFEGLTIVLLNSPGVVLQVFVAILIHKIPVAFSLGLNLVQSELKTSAVIHFNLWFSLMTPIGAGIGVILNTLPSLVNIKLLNGILVGLSTGTFIFVVFIEILPKELKRGGTRLLNVLFLIMGFSVVCVAVLIESTNSC